VFFVGKNSDHKPLIFELTLGTKIDQNPKFESRRVEITDHLCSMSVAQAFDCLDLQDDLVISNEVRDEFLFEQSAFVTQRQLDMWCAWQLPDAQLKLQALLVNRLKKARTFLAIHLEAGTHDMITLLLVDDP
jgi:hypothetical protein